MRARRTQRGLSLIELLVVMVILVIGIFSVARIFPQGFRFITHARNQTLAARLSQAEVERWKAYAENVPEGIEAIDPGTGLPWTDYNPNDMSNADLSKKPAGEPDEEYLWDWSNVNRVRAIKGETTVIPQPSVMPYNIGGDKAFSIYSLKFAPVEFMENSDKEAQPLPPGYAWPDQYVLIYGDPMPRYNLTELSDAERQGVLDDLGRPTYAIDYDTGKLYFHPEWIDRKYKVEYDYWDGGVLKHRTEIVTVPASASFPNQLPSTAVEAGPLEYKPDPYSETVARKFMYVAPGSFQHWDPYEFTLLNTYNDGGNTLSFAPTIGFNPVGAERTVRTNLGSRPLTAHIDYEVLDWHVIHEDRTVPSSLTGNGNYQIHLTLPMIKAAGRRYSGLNAVNPPSVTSRGSVDQVIYGGITPGMQGYSVVALDLTDNTLLLDRKQGSPATPGAMEIDFTDGIVTIPETVTKYTPFGQPFTQNIGGHDIRIFYQAVGDWAVQVSKAWANYRRNLDTSVSGNWANLQYDQFSAHVVAPNQGLTGLPGYQNGDRWAVVLVFPRKDAGQSVAVSFLWTDVNGINHEVTGRQHKLPEYAALAKSYPYVAVPFADANDYKLPAGDAWLNNPNFTFVQGASLKVRTIWREDPRRWEVRDLETFLNRK